MIERNSFKYYAMLTAFALFFSIQLNAVTNWHGGNQSGDVTITPSSGLDIENINYLLTPVNIINNTSSPTPANVTISADSVVSSSQQLYFYLSPGSVTNVLVTNDLVFTGSNGQNFLITASGSGTLNFYISGGETLSLSLANTLINPGSNCSVTSGILSSSINAGVIFLVDMIGGSPTVNFQPATTTLTGNATVEVGYNSAISFLGNTPGQTGIINFDSSVSPASTGRFILQIDNGGAVVNDVAQLTGLPVTLQNIAFNQPFSIPNFGSPVINFVANNVPGGFAGALIVNGNTQWAGLTNNPFCELAPTSTTVIKKGFVLGAGSNLTVAPGTYIDYVVTVTNVTLTPNIPNNVLNVPCQRFTNRIIKDRNPAAMIIDGNEDNSNPATITMSGNSAIYFRSGVDCLGNSCEFAADGTISFTVNPANNFSNEGTILLDVEGPLIVNGNSGITDDPAFPATAFQILSWQVAPQGGSVLINQTDTTFPLRTFAQDANGNYLQYGSGCFFVNNKMQLNHMHLQHTDEIHPIYEDNIAGQSSASYIGGDRLNICLPTNPACPCANALVVPAIQFYSSFFDLHTSAAYTGLSFQVVNDAPFASIDNTTRFVFYGNGRCIDNGTGRSLIIGTEVGSEASDWQTIVSRDGQLDIMQTNSTANPFTIDLTLSVSYNNFKVTPNIVGNINGQLGVNTVYLAFASNISIGSQDPTFGGTSIPALLIGGEFFSLMTQGGNLNSPETSGTTGQGGMFVDHNGFVSAGIYRANFGMMVTKSSNGDVNLPSNQVFFDPRVGISQWKLNLNDPGELVIVPAGVTYSDYTIDWQNLFKDYCGTYSQALFVPYEPTTVPFVPATLYPVIPANLNGLPIVYGSVEQLQVLNSRLGDQVHLLIDGTFNGIVREFVFLPGTASATAPVGVLVLQNNALVGLGTAARNQDSLNASVVLGINGVTLLPNGDATVRLNVNTLINNYCHIVTGTLFGSTPIVGNRLLIDSVVPTELRIKSDGVLDLTQFTSTVQTLVISGAVNMVLEPGAQVLLGGGNLIFEGDSRCYCEPDTSVNVAAGTTVESTDQSRVSFVGSGRVTFKENAQFVIPRGALVGIESVASTNALNYSAATNQSWALTDNAQFSIGSASEYGGGFQIGNVVDDVDNPLIDFTLILTGVGALLDLNSQGFLGLGVGIVNNPNS
jgi:hypothetical protein